LYNWKDVAAALIREGLIIEVHRHQMRRGRTIRNRPAEAGIALLISIFVLLLISVVAIALIVSSGTESALAGNYRSSTGVYYAAMAGLEEVRARLRPQGPISFKSTAPGFLPAAGVPLASCSPVYVINPVGGENVAPWDTTSTYGDTEFNQEFAGICGLPNPSPSTLSIWNRSPLNGLPFPGPLYKWVRINGASERSLKLDVDADSLADSNTPLYYDNINSRFSNDSTVGPQVLEITALAVLPNGSQKLVQYLVAAAPLTLPPSMFLAALTLSGRQGSDAVFQAPTTNAVYSVKGDNYNCNGNPAGLPAKAIGIYGPYQGVGNLQNAVNAVKGGIPTNVSGTNPQNNYTGSGPSTPDVEPLNPPFQTPSQLDAIVQTIIQNADIILPSGPVNYPLPTVTGSALTSLGMSSTNPLTVVVNGNLDISNWAHDGYGLLLVTGTFIYDPDTNWNGIVLVIGQGVVNNAQNGQYKQISGAMFVAQTRDASGNLLPNLGGASVTFNPNMQGNGMRYSSCWIQKAQPAGSYQILSFHEISSQ
jgi:hypothetical protein